MGLFTLANVYSLIYLFFFFFTLLAIICPVCLNNAKHPFTARCGHICCSGCWQEVLKKALECPVCRARTRVKQLTKLYF